jgi:hypothetical protein
MGTWGFGAFDNDDALDWLDELKDSGDLSPLEEAINNVLESGDGGYIEIPEASIALAAAEVIASLLGNPGGELPEEIAGWLSGKGDSIDPDLVARAREAVARVSTDSELLEVIEESDDAAEWKHRVIDLLARLS